jgi:hypothetical protein
MHERASSADKPVPANLDREPEGLNYGSPAGLKEPSDPA